VSGDVAFQKCIIPTCGFVAGVSEVHQACPRCANLLDVCYDWDALAVPPSMTHFEKRWADRLNPLDFSGVWRFRELLSFAPAQAVISIGEGQTLLRRCEPVAAYAGMKRGSLYLQYEGLNPSGSFKDNGMTATFTHARMVGAEKAACASTGNTSASVALYAACSGLLRAIIFIGKGKIALGKLVQALDSGALTLEIQGDFDDAMKRVMEVCRQEGIYLMNSVNPFRLEGQKAIMYRVLEALCWEPPDWIIVPGGNLGNSSAFGKAFLELSELGLIRRIPRLAVVNSAGASTLYTLMNERGLRWNRGSPDDRIIASYYEELDRTGKRAKTIASAIEINRPVNLKKCLRALEVMNGVVCQVTDEEILDAKAKIAASSIGCEPASAASVAGAKRLVEEGTIGPDERVVCILTGHQLKDQGAAITYHALPEREMRQKLKAYGVRRASFKNMPVQVANDLDAIRKAIAAASGT